MKVGEMKEDMRMHATHTINITVLRRVGQLDAVCACPGYKCLHTRRTKHVGTQRLSGLFYCLLLLSLFYYSEMHLCVLSSNVGSPGCMRSSCGVCTLSCSGGGATDIISHLWRGSEVLLPQLHKITQRANLKGLKIFWLLRLCL